ncbi:MAG: epoxyqueuosine reductase QueH [Candidatus Buchananbacteria bacterium]|nr:epoxyqueuosine reductase QueH [Candidatus Buchananbacteria bacterium]
MSEYPKPQLLFHSCCAPCSGYLVSELANNFAVTIYYDNSNIYPESEYQIRKNEAKNFFTSCGTKFFEVEYDHSKWLETVKGWENEPERGKRCILCYHLRLQNAAKYAKDNGYDLFSSSLSISPYKNSRVLNNLGRALAKKIGLEFLDEDWKKKDRFKKSVEFSKSYGFYRQNYCGCEFSKKDDKRL